MLFFSNKSKNIYFGVNYNQMALDVVIYCSLLLVPESAVCTFKEVVIFIEYFFTFEKVDNYSVISCFQNRLF